MPPRRNRQVLAREGQEEGVTNALATQEGLHGGRAARGHLPAGRSAHRRHVELLPAEERPDEQHSTEAVRAESHEVLAEQTFEREGTQATTHRSDEEKSVTRTKHPGLVENTARSTQTRESNG